MTIQYVTKRDGNLEKFDTSKVLSWELWACNDVKKYIDWKDIIIKVKSYLYDKMSTQEIQLLLIEECNSRQTWYHSLVAGRLYAAYISKKIFPQFYPSLKELHESLYNLGLTVKLNFTDKEYEELENVIDHQKDYNLAYMQVFQAINKYGLTDRVTKQLFETPQFVYMRMAMALSEDEEDKIEKTKKFYKYFSENKINAPTPNFINLGTKLDGYISCCLYTAGDSAPSLAIGDHIAYTMTYMSAGIGSFINTRSINDKVRNGSISHQGKLPYFKAVAGAVNANTQSGRGGAANEYFICYDPEAIDIIYLQNPRTPVIKQNRDIHFTIEYNSLFVEKVAKNEDIFTFNVYTAPDLVTAFFSGDKKLFKEIYTKYENDTTFKKNYVSARDIAIKAALKQAHEVATLYFLNIDEVNTHTPFKDPIYQSNLCVAPETRILTKEHGYAAIGTLKDESVHVWNGEEWSKVTVKQTGTNQSLLKVTTSIGTEINATPYHKWYIADVNAHGDTIGIKEKTTSELVPGDMIIKFGLPVVHHGSKRLGRDAFFIGKNTGINQHVSDIRVDSEDDKIVRSYMVPSNEYSQACRLNWLNGLITSANESEISASSVSCKLDSYNLAFLKDVLYLCNELGIFATINPTKYEGRYRILIRTYNDTFLVKPPEHVNEKLHRYIKVTSIKNEGRKDRTFCVNEPKRHTVMFEGVLTGNCTEIVQPTKPYYRMEDLYSTEEHENGEISLCALGGIVPAFIESDAEYEDVAYYTLLMIDKCIHRNKYVFPHLEYTAKSRMNAGVGMVGIAYDFAHKGLKISSREGRTYAHYLSERHSYFLIKASLRLGRERGNAKWIHKTKWPEGWLPIDTYNRAVDETCDATLHYDWETLRKEIVANGGIRNSVLVSHMPTESSSKVTGLPNGVYPVRDIYLKKSDGSKAVDYVVRDSDTIADQYELAWDISVEHLCMYYGILQKFSDGGISADFYSDRTKVKELKASRLMDEFMYMFKYGLKSRYYTNSKTTQGNKLENLDEAKGCNGGYCTL